MSHCGVMICVEDTGCMDRCAESNFPCYHFRYVTHHANLPDIRKLGPAAGALEGSVGRVNGVEHVSVTSHDMPSVLEMIGYLKLFHIPRALKSGVDVLVVLDLDVGFLGSPQPIVNYMYNMIPSGSSSDSGRSSSSSSVGDGRKGETALPYVYDYTKYNNLDILVQQDVTFIMNRSAAGWCVDRRVHAL